MRNYYYPGLDYPASQLSAYILAKNIFIIALEDSMIIHFKPKDVTAFRQWLFTQGVRDIEEMTRRRNMRYMY